MGLSSKTAFLSYLARLNPKLWEIIHPHVPKFSVGTRDVMAAMIIKANIPCVKDPAKSRELGSIGKRLFAVGVKGMSYDDDDWCPTRPRPQLGPEPIPWSIFSEFDEVLLNPQPLPPREQFYYGGLLTLLSETVSSKEIAASLNKMGAALMETTMPKKSK